MRGPKPKVIKKGGMSDIPTVPEWLSKAAKAEWKRVIPILTDRKILTVADLAQLENYCCSIGQIRDCEKLIQKHGQLVENDKGALSRNPAISIQADAMTRSRLLACELGLTPVSRSRPSMSDDTAGVDENLGLE